MEWLYYPAVYVTFASSLFTSFLHFLLFFYFTYFHSAGSGSLPPQPLSSSSPNLRSLMRTDSSLIVSLMKKKEEEM